MKNQITAPCGHTGEGEVVFGNFTKCLRPGCDGKAAEVVYDTVQGPMQLGSVSVQVTADGRPLSWEYVPARPYDPDDDWQVLDRLVREYYGAERASVDAALYANRVCAVEADHVNDLYDDLFDSLVRDFAGEPLTAETCGKMMMAVSEWFGEQMEASEAKLSRGGVERDLNYLPNTNTVIGARMFEGAAQVTLESPERFLPLTPEEAEDLALRCVEARDSGTALRLRHAAFVARKAQMEATPHGCACTCEDCR